MNDFLLSAAKIEIAIDENSIPVCTDVQGACEILGFDPLYIANERWFVIFILESDVDKALEIMRLHPVGTSGQIIDRVTQISSGMVTIKSKIGSTRIVNMLSGE